MNDSWTYHSRVSERYRYITIATPKVGCTTIKRTLHELEGLPPAERLALVHDAGTGMRLSRYSTKELAAMLASDDWLKFTFVRNPYDRMLSAWKSKMLDPRDTQYAPLRARIRAAFEHEDESRPIPFGDFVRFIINADDEKVTGDGHWERQSVIGLHDVIPYDVVGRFESFHDDFDAILERLDAPADVRALAAEVTNPTIDAPVAAPYDDEIAALVYDYYRVDFDAFGYDRDSWFTPKSQP